MTHTISYPGLELDSNAFLKVRNSKTKMIVTNFKKFAPLSVTISKEHFDSNKLQMLRLLSDDVYYQLLC